MTAHAARSSFGPAASGRSIAAMVLGILGVALFPLFAPFAWYLGHVELDDIESFRAPREGRGFARAGQVLGIVGSVPLLLIAVIVAFAVPMLIFAAIVS